MAVLEHHEVHHMLQWTSFSGGGTSKLALDANAAVLGALPWSQPVDPKRDNEMYPPNADFESWHHAPP